MSESKKIADKISAVKQIVLIAEDDRFLSKILTDKLLRRGFEVITAADGIEAVSKAKNNKFDIILLDLIMPNKDGFQVLSDLRADPLYQKVPIIILSNLGQEKDITEGKRLGATDYLVKSNLSIEEVVTKVKAVLSKVK